MEKSVIMAVWNEIDEINQDLEIYPDLSISLDFIMERLELCKKALSPYFTDKELLDFINDPNKDQIK